MKRLLCIALLLVLCIAITGCTQQPGTPSTTGTPTVTHSTTIPVTPATGNVLAELSNARPNTSLTLDPGTFILSFKTDGPQKMVFQIDGYQDDETTELSTTGPFSGSLTFGPVIKTGIYSMSVKSNGSWIAQLTRADPKTPLTVPINLSGSGTQVTPFFYLEKGQYFFERKETGLSSPMYFLRYANGSYLMDANNTYVQPGFGEDSPHPFLFIYITESGNYFLNTLTNKNPGTWSASISPVPAIPPMGPGPARLEKGVK
ncbi:MAG: hypothetical protein Q7T80_08570 [Methanoregula sp.]|nr:hypothetical protein [Methanoregula sp.]